MSLSQKITEEEYDKLPPQTQREYCYCPVCNMFYSKYPGICNHY